MAAPRMVPATQAPAGPSPEWLLEQEARALLTRLDRVKPFVLQETMVPAAGLMPASQIAIDRYLLTGRRRLRDQVRAYIQSIRGPGRTAPPPEMQRRFTVLKLQDLGPCAANRRQQAPIRLLLGTLLQTAPISSCSRRGPKRRRPTQALLP